MIYTKDNPKLVENVFDFKGRQTFIGVEYYWGDKEWWVNGKCHREDGPAIEWIDCRKYWYLNDTLHREDGPAIELADGNKAWHLNGKQYGKNDDFTNESWMRFVKLELLK